jgi:hypothetical protein
VLVHTTASGLSHRAFVDCALAVFEASERTLPDRNAPVTAQALRDARDRVSGRPGACAR